MTKQKPQIDEERRSVLRGLVEGLAARQLAAIHILGHGLKFVTELDVKLRVAEELDRALALFRGVHAVYGELGWTDLESALRERALDVPYPESRMEFGVAYYLIGLADDVAMHAFTESAHAGFADLAKAHVASAAKRPEPTRIVEYCSDPANRPHGQELVNLWVTLARRSFTLVDPQHDARALDLGLKSKGAADLDHTFCERLEPFLERCGLVLPQ